MIYVALLRGINVGGNNKIDMKKLKKSLEHAGLILVTTYINSGNIIFSHDSLDKKMLEETIESVIVRDFELKIKVLLINATDYSNIMSHLPSDWVNDVTMKSDVMFLWEPVDRNEIPIKDVDEVILLDQAILWKVDRINQSKSGQIKLVGSKIYSNMTIRNVNTARKISELIHQVTLDLV